MGHRVIVNSKARWDLRRNGYRAWRRPSANETPGRPVPGIVGFGIAHTWYGCSGGSWPSSTVRRVRPRGRSHRKLYTTCSG